MAAVNKKKCHYIINNIVNESKDIYIRNQNTSLRFLAEAIKYFAQLVFKKGTACEKSTIIHESSR